MTGLATVNTYHTAEDVRAARWAQMRLVNEPVWRLRQLHADWLLTDEQESVLRRIDELDWLARGNDPIARALTLWCTAGSIDDDLFGNADQIRADFWAAGAGPVTAALVDSDIVLRWANDAAVSLSTDSYILIAPGLNDRGLLADVHEKLEEHAHLFGVAQYRPDTAARKIDRIRKLYTDTCAATVDGCSDDLEMFLADLSLLLDS